MITRPMFPYYGGKFKLAPHYPAPQYDKIVEPFAGSAGYSIRHAHMNIALIDQDDWVCATWDYLIKASKADIMALPIVKPGETTEDHTWPCEEARKFVGYWLQPGTTHPGRKLSTWGVQKFGTKAENAVWSEPTRADMAEAVEQIKHWTIRQGSWTEAMSMGPCTFFVDPPYSGWAGRKYRRNHNHVNFQELAAWCMEGDGQFIVCESAGADWLPFEIFRSHTGIKKTSQELVYVRSNTP